MGLLSGIKDVAAGAASASVMKWVYIGAGVVVLSAFLGIGGYAWSMKAQAEDLNKQIGPLIASNEILEANNKNLKATNLNLQSANETNLQTINALLKERDQAKQILEAVAKMEKLSKASNQKVAQALTELNKDPSTDGPIAPVLKEVMRQLQTQRGSQK